MSAYTFSTVTGVLSLGEQRSYVPRAARPHLCWATLTSPSASLQLGKHSRLKGDGTAARATASEEGEAGGYSSSLSQQDAAALRALLTTDSVTGACLALYHDLAAPQAPLQTAVIPSQRRVVALWSPPQPSPAAHDALSDLLSGAVPLFVSDDVGNVFSYHWSMPDTSMPAAKRHRGEQVADVGNRQDAGAWTLVASSHSTVPSAIAAPPPESTVSTSAATADGLFAVTRGGAGWNGVTALNPNAGNAATTVQLVSVREFYHDVRVIDPLRQTVVRTFATTHAPTGVLCPSAHAAAHCALVAEGCLATLFDVRCPSAVLALGDVYTAQAEWVSAREAAAAAAAAAAAVATSNGAASARERGTDSDEVTETARQAVSASSSPSAPLVPGRLTSTVGQVRDVCCTANPFEVACAVDRALCVYDLRKFNRLFTSSSVLKYVIDGVASVAGGRGVVCSGIDSEVRLIPLYEKAQENTEETLSLATRATLQVQKKKQPADVARAKDKADGGTAGAAPAFDVETMGPGGTFRTRLNTSVSCTSVWQGGWVTTQNGNGVAAVGISANSEVFFAQ